MNKVYGCKWENWYGVGYKCNCVDATELILGYLSNRELKQAMVLSNGWIPEVNILHATLLVFPRFLN